MTAIFGQCSNSGIDRDREHGFIAMSVCGLMVPTVVTSVLATVKGAKDGR